MGDDLRGTTVLPSLCISLQLALQRPRELSAFSLLLEVERTLARQLLNEYTA
ncbi:hypothetical protein ACVWXP_003839 [Bradyrhizobium sp. USDA 4463]